MSDILRSVGLDVGTTSTQMIFSELTVENKASGFAVPEMEIARRDIRYRSPVYFTPLLDESHVDAGALRELVAEEYRKAGIRRESVDTGAIIITGETSRKENARAALDALSERAAALPPISIETASPVGLMGHTTEEAMRSGVLYGHASMVDGMLERIEESIGQSVTTVATGGNAPRILRYCKRPIQYDADLIMTGLYLLYQKNAKKYRKA